MSHAAFLMFQPNFACMRDRFPSGDKAAFCPFRRGLRRAGTDILVTGGTAEPEKRGSSVRGAFRAAERVGWAAEPEKRGSSVRGAFRAAERVGWAAEPEKRGSSVRGAFRAAERSEWAAEPGIRGVCRFSERIVCLFKGFAERIGTLNMMIAFLYPQIWVCRGAGRNGNCFLTLRFRFPDLRLFYYTEPGMSNNMTKNRDLSLHIDKRCDTVYDNRKPMVLVCMQMDKG